MQIFPRFIGLPHLLWWNDRSFFGFFDISEELLFLCKYSTLCFLIYSDDAHCFAEKVIMLYACEIAEDIPILLWNTTQKVRPKRQTVIPLDRSLVTLSLKEKNCLIWRPNENGLTDVGFAGVIEHPAWAKLTPVRKFGAPRESKYALRSGISIASTAEVYEQEWDCRQQNSM